jgi:hypothetical protein
MIRRQAEAKVTGTAFVMFDPPAPVSGDAFDPARRSDRRGA